MSVRIEWLSPAVTPVKGCGSGSVGWTGDGVSGGAVGSAGVAGSLGASGVGPSTMLSPWSVRRWRSSIGGLRWRGLRRRSSSACNGAGVSANGGRAGRGARRGVRVAEAPVAASFLVLLVLFVLLVVARFVARFVAMEAWASAGGLRLCFFALVVVFFLFLRAGRVCRDVAVVRPVLRPLDRWAVFPSREATPFFAPPARRPAVGFRRVDRFRGVDLGRVLATPESFRSLTAVR